MVTLNLAYTSQINTGKPSPTLTIPQVWAGLQRKVRAGHEFVPAIVSTDVIEEKTDGKKNVPVVVREVVFKEGNRRVREECYEYAPIKVSLTACGQETGRWQMDKDMLWPEVLQTTGDSAWRSRKDS